jgi:hypothetical protein
VNLGRSAAKNANSFMRKEESFFETLLLSTYSPYKLLKEGNKRRLRVGKMA